MDCNSKSAKADVFQPLDALCTTEDGMNLSTLTSEQQISLLCDSKVAGDESFYRLSEEKALSWILRKHHLLAQHPRVNAQHASDIVSQYLNDRWTAIFRNSLEAQAPIEEASSATQSPADLAMSIMMNDAKENNITACMPQANGKRKQLQGKNIAPSKKKKQEVNKGAAKWWASQRSSRSNRTASSGKKTLRSTATK
ncbi:Ribonuclease H2 subunit B wHTH [Gracilaria domingensis]|nr:Ribonuclease H2 subunit B wHTH [Gracilaria domingensis]